MARGQASSRIPVGDFSFYALGLDVGTYRGRKILHHTGGLPGYLSSVAWIPSERAGVVVLTNDESMTFLALTWTLMDRVLRTPQPFDFITLFDYTKADANAFEDMVAELRTTEEWKYVERETDLRMVRAAREQGLIEAGGGHAMAAGFSLMAEDRKSVV